jgi:hypothetical protein
MHSIEVCENAAAREPKQPIELHATELLSMAIDPSRLCIQESSDLSSGKLIISGRGHRDVDMSGTAKEADAHGHGDGTELGEQAG